MAGLAAATCDASFRCNGWVAVSPGVSPAGAPASTYAAQTTSVSGSRSGGSLFALCVRPTGPNPTRTRNHHSMAHLEIARRNPRNLLLPKGSWVASNNDFNKLTDTPAILNSLQNLCKLSLAHQTPNVPPGPKAGGARSTGARAAAPGARGACGARLPAAHCVFHAKTPKSN